MNAKEYETDPLFQRIKVIRKYPFYFGRKSLKLLETYLFGFMDGMDYQAGEKTDNPEWYERFSIYVKKKLVNGSPAHNLYSAIYQAGYDDENGFDFFFQILDEFMEHDYDMKKEIEKEQQRLEEGTAILALKLGRIAVTEIVGEYFAEHREKIFHLSKEKEDMYAWLYSWDREMNCICIVHNDKESFARVEECLKLMEGAEPLDSIHEEHPYKVL